MLIELEFNNFNILFNKLFQDYSINYINFKIYRFLRKDITIFDKLHFSRNNKNK